MKKAKKIVILGAESTGKTELAEHLAAKYKTIFMPEFAREYVEKLDRPYNFNDVNCIGLKQIEEEQKALRKARNILFYDTFLIITKVWFEHVFGTVPFWLSEKLPQLNIDLFLLCNNDIVWQYDPVRENPDIREFLFEKYKGELDEYGFNYQIVKGIGEKRISLAEQFVEEVF